MPTKKSKKFDVASFCLRVETEDMDHDEIVAGFQKLIDSGVIHSLQGSHQRTAQSLIDSGQCTAPKKPDAPQNGVEAFVAEPGELPVVVVNLTRGTDFAGDRTYLAVARDGRVYQIEAKPHEVGEVDAGSVFLLSVQGSPDYGVEKNPKIDWNRIRRPDGRTFRAGAESVASRQTGLRNVTTLSKAAAAWQSLL